MNPLHRNKTALASVLIPASLVCAGAASALPCVQPTLNAEFPLYGDVNGSGAVNVADAICITLASLWTLNPNEPLPTCVADDLLFADLTCDGIVDVGDTLACISLTLDGGLSAALDPQGRGCAEACVPSCESCPAGVPCAGNAACESGVCAAGICQAPSCDDGVLNGDETDVDCGGSCPGCGEGQGCAEGSDCAAGVCGDGECLAPACDDGVKNGDETDVDCGGSCPGCATGQLCQLDDDCGGAWVGEFGACSGFDGICGEVGEHQREVHTPSCEAGQCAVLVSLDEQSCERVTAGELCGEPLFGEWSACEGFEGICGEVGSQSREVTDFSCASGECESTTSAESQACFRDTDGLPCGEQSCGEWAECTYASVCAPEGSQSRLCDAPTCGGGACASAPFSEQQGCVRNTDGQQCAPPSPGPWGSCSYGDTCAELGERTRPVVTYSCAAGGCDPSFDVETEPCQRDTTGVSCGSDLCGSWGACDYSDVCATAGSRARSCQSFACGEGSCLATLYTDEETCERDTEGVVCAPTEVGPWGPCEVLNVCDTTGTRLRVLTSYGCAADACTPHTFTEDEPCTPSNIPAPASITTPPSATAVCAGQDADFSVVASGDGLSYRWELSEDGGASWADVPAEAPFVGVNAPSLQIAAAPSSLSGARFRAVVTGTCGPAATSGAATLTVNTVPTAVSATASPNPICEGQTLELSATGGGATSWSWTGPGGYSSTSQSPARGTITTAHAGIYTVTASNACGPASASTASVVVQVSPSITSQPSHASLCAGGDATFSVAAAGTGLTYQWQTRPNPDASWSNLEVGGVYAGVGTPTLTVSGATADLDGRQHRCRVSGACGNVNSSARTLTVNTAPTGVTAAASPSPVCAGSTLSLSASASGATSWSWSGPASFSSTAQNPSRSNVTTSHAGVYTVTATNACGATSASTPSVTVNTAPTGVGASASPNPVCEGSTLSLSGSGSGATSWSWSGPASYSASSQNASRASVTTSHAGAYSLTATNACGSASANTSSVTVNTAPSIGTQPSNSAVCAGTNTAFTVGATGSGLSYQWQLSTNGGSTWTNVGNTGVYSGATTAALSVTGATASMSGYQYRAQISGTCGSVTSAARTLTVNTAPTAVSASATPNPICAGSTLSLTASASGATSWSWSGPASFSSTAQNPNRTNVATSHAGVYTVTATNACGSTSANTASVNVNTAPTAVSASATPNPICAGSTLSLSASASGATSWSWSGPASFSSTAQNPNRASVATSHAGVYTVTATNACGSTSASTPSVTVNTAPTSVSASASPNPICAGSTLSLSGSGSGATSWSWSGPASYSASSQNASRASVTTSHAGTYSLTATNACGSTGANTSSVTVNTAPSIGTQPSNRTVCAGNNTTFTVGATGSGLSYQWQLSTNGGSTWANVSNTGVYSGATTATLSVTGATANLSGYQYRAQISGTCGNVTSAARTLTVNTAPTAVSASATPNPICAGGTLSLSASASGATSWSWSGPASFSSTAQSPSRASVTTSHAGVYTVTATNACGSTSASTPSVTVNTAPTSVSASASPNPVCAGSTLSLSASASGATSWSWSGPASFSSTAQSPSRGNVATSHAGVYTVTATNACGSTSASTPSVTVNTAPTSVSASASPNPICAGSTLSLSGSGSGATSWSWSGPASYSASSQNASRASVTTSHAGTYSLTATNACGSTGANTSSVTVNTAPSIGTQPSNRTVCAGSNTTFTVAASGSGLGYQWQLSTNSGSTWANVSNTGVYSGATTATLSVTGATTNMSGFQYRVQISGTCGSVTSAARTLTVNATTSIGSQPVNRTICPGGSTTFAVSASGTSLSYQWQMRTSSSGSWSNLSNSGPHSGVTSATLSVSNVTTGMDGYQYRVQINGTCGNVTSATRTLTVPSCPATSCGSWSTCSYASACATSGTRTRQCTSYSCSGGACQSNTYTETGTCTRSTNGNTCQATQTGSWSGCNPNTECSTSGTRWRQITTYTCQSGSCQSNTTTQSESCTAFTECAPCWSGGFGICIFGSCQVGVQCP